MSATECLSANNIASSLESYEDVNIARTSSDKIVPISIRSDFHSFFKGKFVTLTGIHREFTAPIHELLHIYGTLYDYKEGCDVVVIVGKDISEKRLKTISRKYPNATFIEYNRELSDFVNCDYDCAINLEYKYRDIKKENETRPAETNIAMKILIGIIALVVVCFVAYISFGFFLLLMIFVPGVAKAIFKNLF